MDKEEGEMSDDNAMIVDDVTSPIEDNSNCTIVSKLNLGTDAIILVHFCYLNLMFCFSFIRPRRRGLLLKL